jgi:membrane protease YdiL (CAAX protease family)
MPNTLDIIMVVLLTVGWPAYEYFIDWPRFRRWLDRDPGRARLRGFQTTMLLQWGVSALAAFVWLRAGRSWEDIGLRAVDGWRMWLTAVFALLMVVLTVVQVRKLDRSENTRAEARESRQVKSIEKILPRTSHELTWFLLLSVTAGICEEFLYRGFLISVLSMWVGWWPAAAIAIVPFGVLHGYQGWRGVINTAIVGSLMTILVWLTHSLIPAMIMHALADIQGGIVSWTILRERPGESR